MSVWSESNDGIHLVVDLVLVGMIVARAASLLRRRIAPLPAANRTEAPPKRRLAAVNIVVL